MTNSKKRLFIGSAKQVISDYWDIEIKAKKRYPDDKDNDDYQVDLFQLDSEKKRLDTFHPIEDISKIADALKLSIYVTVDGVEDRRYIKVHVF